MIKFIEKDQIWQNETTNYWFDVNGKQWAISDSCGELKLLDHDGYPVESCNDHDNLLEILTPHYQSHVKD